MVAKALHHVSLNVNEVSPAIDFYEALGFASSNDPTSDSTVHG